MDGDDIQAFAQTIEKFSFLHNFGSKNLAQKKYGGRLLNKVFNSSQLFLNSWSTDTNTLTQADLHKVNKIWSDAF